MAWTPEQLEAINKSGCNIIVSAGAGSGKTAVLSERVIEKIKSGIHVNELLILTFTRAAASEMKDRIRKKISKINEFKDELNLINSAYITTFDSFALSIVKKYFYLLNVPSSISISDESIIVLEEKRIMDEIFEELYSENNKDFEYLIDSYCVKNDSYLRDSLLRVANTINERIDTFEYLDFIKNDFFTDEYIDNIICDYKIFLENKRSIIKMELDNLNYYFDSKTADKFYDSLNGLLNCDINELNLINKISLPRISRYPSEEAKGVKENFKNIIDDLISYNEYGSFSDIKESIINNKRIVLSMVNIIEEYIKRVNSFKKSNDIYTFGDIADMAIDILSNYNEACDELKYSFKEIMIDEYQDNNDIQEKIISLIENNNVYMVGDIKQSIYRFRGSNPSIFKAKYDKYSNGKDGYKIDLIKNFRSRDEVLNNINRIFELLMDDSLGGANYKVSHEMVYGNTLYDSNIEEKLDYNINILEYNREKNSKFSNSEIEIFTIANDIKNKVESGIKVFDKSTNTLRSVTYNDFVIILDRSKYFSDYKKIFEYLSIPLTILKDEKLNTSVDILLIRNIFDFILRINNEDYGIEFKYDFMSIGRSFLYEYTDEYLFNNFVNDTIKDTKLYSDFSNIESINSKSISELLDEVLDITDYYSKIYKVGDYEDINIRLKSLSNISSNLNDIGFNIEEFINYLDKINEEGLDIRYNSSNTNSDSVKIMTIHKSKGLEYPICYFADLDHSFNISDSNDLFVISNKYGLIVPNNNEISVLKKLYKNDYMKEEISEKIRLFYVALTRAREKIIIVLPNKETITYEKNSDGVIDEVRRLGFNKLSDFVYSIKNYLNEYFSEIDLSKLNLTKDYLYIKKINNKLKDNKDSIVVEEINIDNSVSDDVHFSKESNKLIDRKTISNMKYGTDVHEMFELIDLKNYKEELIEDKNIRNKISKFINNDIMKNIKNGNIYHEYEFMYSKENNNYHGIIDLMVEYKDYIDIIDFKLKNIDDENYINQLNGYKNYISSISNKKINLYLYSIIDDKFECIE